MVAFLLRDSVAILLSGDTALKIAQLLQRGADMRVMRMPPTTAVSP